MNEQNSVITMSQQVEPAAKQAPHSSAKRFLRVIVTSSSGVQKANVNIPLGLVKVAVKFGMGFIPEKARAEMLQKGIDLAQIDLDELVRLIDEGVSDGRLVDVDVDDPKEGRIRVEVYVA